MNIKPIRKNIAVVRIKEKRETASGIILEGTRTTEVDKGRVIATGPEVSLVKVQDVLLVNWGKIKAQMTLNDIPVYMIDEDDVDGVFEETA